jgi:small redox-active disulfide protein 2
MALIGFKHGFKEGTWMVIKILGTGCKNCKVLFSNVQTAVDRLHAEAQIEYITDMEAIANTGILRTPGLIINDKVVSQGKVLAPIEIENLIQKILRS